MTRQRTRSHDYWNEQPDGFAKYYRRASSVGTFVSRFLHQRTEMILSLVECTPEQSVLDVGCGSGIHMKLLAPRCRQMAGIDYSAKMISRAELELKAAGLGNWSLQQADAEVIPFGDLSFDWVVATGLLDYVPSPARVLRDCVRVLKDAGAIVLTTPKSPSLFAPLRTGFGNLVKKHVFDLPPIDQVFNRGQLDTLLESAGLRATHVSSVWTTMWMVRAVKRPR